MATETKHTRDRGLVSNEPWEIEYIHKNFPGRSHQEVEAALQSAKQELGGSEEREKIMELMRKILV
jgi:hypothetical protein